MHATRIGKTLWVKYVNNLKGLWIKYAQNLKGLWVKYAKNLKGLLVKYAKVNVKLHDEIKLKKW